ncbi:MAG: hypothetical protein HGB12_12965 [Bacteroidetes bacterium]|nr:hypothetical protein [Bacteroidota bacterium]
MISKSLQEEISSIEYEWRHLSKESTYDHQFYLFISIKSTALKLRIHSLRELVKKQIETDNKTKLAYQMLVNSLQNMESLLDFKAKTENELDKEHMKYVMEKIQSIEPEIEILRKYITN